MFLRESELQLRHHIAGPSLGSVDLGSVDLGFSPGREAPSEYQTVRPHAVQKCAPGQANVPHWQQNRPPAGTATSLTALYGSAVQAQTSAISQPITVHPRNRLSRKIPAASRLSRPMMAGRKYRRTRKSRVSTVHPFHCNLGAADTPARLYPIIRFRLSKCSSRLGSALPSGPVSS